MKILHRNANVQFPSPARGRKILPLWIARLILLVLLFQPAVGTAAEGPPGLRVLTLDQALAIAAERNRDIQKAREYIAYVRGRYVEERAAAFPQVSATASLGQDRDESLKIYSPIQTERTDRRSVKVGFTQALFTWGQVSAAIRAAEVGLKSADEQVRLFRQAAFLDASAAFYDVLLAREIHSLALQNLEQKRRHLEEAKRKYQAGVATDYDVLAAEVSVDNAYPETIRTENQVRSARERLRFLLALENEEVDAAGSLEIGISPHRSYEEALALAREKRPDLADLRYRIRVFEERVTVTDAQDKPRIDLKGEYGWNYLEQPSLHSDGPAWNVGVQLSYPFFDGLRTRGRVAQAKSDLRSLRIDEAKQLDKIALETRDALNAVRESEEILRSLAGTVVQAERLLAMAEKGFTLGVKNRLDVEDAELNLQQARSGLSRARRDYLVARVNLDWVAGSWGMSQDQERRRDIPADAPSCPAGKLSERPGWTLRMYVRGVSKHNRGLSAQRGIHRSERRSEMKHQEGFFKGVRGTSLYHQGWLPEDGAKAVILVVHGLAEHSGRYMNLVNRFVPQNYAVYGMDHLGHGKSEGPRLYVERFTDFTEPLKTYLGMVRTWQPGKPVFLVGHSMGALIAALFLIEEQAGLAGVVLSGPAVKPPGNIPAATIVAGRILAALFPRAGISRPDVEAVSRDPAVVEAYLTDPLVCREKMTARLGAEMLGAMERVRNEAGRIVLPILIVQGDADRLVDPSGARLLHDKVASSDKKLIVYEGLYHEVFNEPEHEQVFADVEKWLAAHLPDALTRPRRVAGALHGW